jgi:uncharacterized protein YegP (UPF0339 family)
MATPSEPSRGRVTLGLRTPLRSVRKTNQREKSTMAGYFELKRSAKGEFMFNLKAGNHETILTSETYSSRAAAENGIDSVRRNGVDDGNFERKTAKDGSAYFTLKSPANGQVIGKSEMYSSPSSRDGGIDSVKRNAATAEFKDRTA